jgi:hypothetical protein
LDKITKEFYSLLENNRDEGWEDFSFSDREIVCCPCSREAMLTGREGRGEGGGGDVTKVRQRKRKHPTLRTLLTIPPGQ